MRAGQVVQDGPPDQLMQHEGVYRSLVMREMSRLADQAAEVGEREGDPQAA